ncbi:hypothetical protein STAQ_29410 [Allostella sp. ATCC 35155]|nr:hypothetical protein STAQ_29410 [Stella sp. ATCC 35155]
MQRIEAAQAGSYDDDPEFRVPFAAGLAHPAAPLILVRPKLGMIVPAVQPRIWSANSRSMIR